MTLSIMGLLATLVINDTQHNNTLHWVWHLTYSYAEIRHAECRSTKCRYAECRYAECRYSECRCAECRYAECHGAFLG
jgi:hypothetical protein